MRRLRTGPKVALSMTLPAVVLISSLSWNWVDNQHHRALVAGARVELAQACALGGLASTLFEISRVTFRIDEGLGRDPAFDSLVAREAQQFATLVATMAPHPELTSGVARLVAVRTRTLGLLRQDNTPRVNGMSQRVAEVRAYYAAIEVLRREAAVGWSSLDRVDAHTNLLFNAGVQAPMQVMPAFSRLVGSTRRVMDGQNDAQRRSDVLAALTEMQVVWRAAVPGLDRLRRSGALPTPMVDAAVRAEQDFESLIERVLIVARQPQPDPHELASLGGGSEAMVKAAFRLREAGETLTLSAQQALQYHLLALEERGRLVAQVWLLLVGATLSLSLYLFVCAFRSVVGGLDELKRRVRRLGSGDLKPGAPPLGGDEVAEVMGSLNDTTHGLRELFLAVTQGVAAVSHASREVALGNGGLASRTGEMRNAIGQVAGSAQQSAQAMDACAEVVQEASELAGAATAEARRGSKAMAALQQRMQALRDGSRQINRMVDLMESVAFQTKLLSLNASVEAARAGELGKGFGVVAAEVRELASRSEHAAANIRHIVQQSLGDIEDSSALAASAAQAVRQADANIHTVDGLMGRVVALTRDGMAQSQQVLGVAGAVESSVAANVQLIDQLSGAAGDLRHQGDALKRSVRHFALT